MRRIIIIILFLALFQVPTFAASLEPSIRVAVMSGQPSLTVEAPHGGILAITDRHGDPLSKSAVVTIVPAKNGLRINGRSTNAQEIQIDSRGEFYRVGARSFKGALRIVQTSDRLTLVNDVPLEVYLVGLVGSEISANWPAEAIKAQVVAARTYAVNQVERTRRMKTDASYDIESTMFDQVYDGAHKEEAHVYQITSVTRGQILTRSGAIYPVFYHSCCGGFTEHARNVWSNIEDSPVVEDRFCARSPKHDWTYEISRGEFQKTLADNGIRIGQLSSVSTMPFNDSPRVDTVIIESNTGTDNIKATELRKMLGYANLKSTWFEVNLGSKNIVFKGQGYGHGVGLCQWGAKGMADEGYAYTDILKFYYPDAGIVTIY